MSETLDEWALGSCRYWASVARRETKFTENRDKYLERAARLATIYLALTKNEPPGLPLSGTRKGDDDVH